MNLEELFTIIEDRKKKIPADSYVVNLFKQGKNKICQKIEEESGEVIFATKNESKQRVIEEVTDLWFHSLVLLSFLDISLSDIFKELEKRKK